MGTQTIFPPNQTVGGTDEKDQMLEQQRMEIHALKQLVERAQAQLNNQQFYPPDQVQVCMFLMKSKKSNIHYTRLILFPVSRVSGAHFRGFAPEPTLKGCSGG